MLAEARLKFPRPFVNVLAPKGDMMRTYDMAVDQCKRDNVWEMRILPHNPEDDQP